MDEQCPGHLPDLQPQRGQCLLAVTPCAQLVVAEARAKGPAEVPCVPAIALPRAQPCAPLVVALEHRPAHQPFGDLARRVDDERQLAGTPDAMNPALGAAAVMNAGRAEACPYLQRGHRMACFVPGRPDGCLPRGREGGKAAAVVALPDPFAVHNGLVVVADDPAQLSLDLGQVTLLCRLHAHAPRSPPTCRSA